MATTVLGALTDYFQTDTTLKTLLSCGATANPWVAQVPENAPLPVCAIMHLGETPDWTFEPLPYQETTLVQFVVYAPLAQNAEAIATAIKARFDWANSALAITNATEVQCQRTNYKLDVVELVRNRNTEIVFQAALDYTITINWPPQV